MAKELKIFAYRTSSLGKCGCRSTNRFKAEYAYSKAEVTRRHHKKYDGKRISVITQEELDNYLRRNPTEKVGIMVEGNWMRYTPDGIRPWWDK